MLIQNKKEKPIHECSPPNTYLGGHHRGWKNDSLIINKGDVFQCDECGEYWIAIRGYDNENNGHRELWKICPRRKAKKQILKNEIVQAESRLHNLRLQQQIECFTELRQLTTGKN